MVVLSRSLLISLENLSASEYFAQRIFNSQSWKESYKSSNINPYPFFKSALQNEWTVAGKMSVRTMRGLVA